MSVVASIELAAAGELPAWAVMGESRHEHSARVASLLEEWALRLGLPPAECSRWRAAGWLHDALRDADHDSLRTLVGSPFDQWPGPLLHGPATAERLRLEGVDDDEFLMAISYHTTGHPSFALLGKALYLADALEPGRTFDPTWTAALRARLPESLDQVLEEVVGRMMEGLIHMGRPIYQEMVGFWNRIVEGSR